MHDQASIERTVAEFAESNPVTADQLLPFLHHVQQANGYIGADAVALIGKLLNLSRAEVFGVVSFYDDFHSEPQTTIVEICGAEACQALGCRSLLANAASKLGQHAIKEVFCLGNCAVGPSARIGNRIIGRATTADIEAALGAALDAEESGA
jgi:formate dehydrogenase subunit gamma